MTQMKQKICQLCCEYYRIALMLQINKINVKIQLNESWIVKNAKYNVTIITKRVGFIANAKAQMCNFIFIVIKDYMTILNVGIL